MNVDKYQLKSAEELTRFELINEGPKGAIRKLIESQATTDPDIYNPAFGDKHPVTGQMDDLVVSDNGDTEKVLATVVTAVYAFPDNHPTAYVYAQDSTKPRTRLYRMVIPRFYKDIQRDFFLYGRIGEDFTEMEPGKEYKGFLAQRKFFLLASMKTVQNLMKKKWPFITIDPALNEYRIKIMFPEKLQQANEVLKNAKLSPNKNRR